MRRTRPIWMVAAMEWWEKRSAREQEQIQRIPIPGLLLGRNEQASTHAAEQCRRDERALFWLQVIAVELGLIAVGIFLEVML